MKIFNIFFIIAFIGFAALQYNDPDPYIWVPIYLYAAFLCYRATQKKYDPVLYYIGLAVYIVYAVYKIFDTNGVLDWMNKHNEENLVQTMKAEKPWIEETREFLGLAIVIIVLLIDMYWLNKIKKRNA